MVRVHAIRRPTSQRIVPLLAALAVVALMLVTLQVSAGAQEPEIDFRILKLDCEEDPGQFPDGVTPEGCEPVEGVEFTISDTEGNELATCTTNAEGRCTVQIVSGTDVVVEEDESTGTPGFTPRENPIETTAVTEFAGAIFVNVKDTKPELPDTGSGDMALALGTGAASIIAVLATLLALGGVLIRRPTPRQ